MKKNKYTLLLVFCLMGFSTLQAQEKFTMTTKLAAGQKFSFTVNYGVEVEVSWGGGSSLTKYVSAGNPITATLAGQVVTVYGNDITLVECSGQSLIGLDVSELTNLRTLICANNELTSLSVDQNRKISKVNAVNNLLENISLGAVNTLKELVVSNNKLGALGVAYNRGMKSLICDNNILTSLSIANLSELETLWCQNNSIKALSLSRNTAIKTLMCQNNQLTTLNISGLTALTNVWCEGNLMTTLDLSSSDAITYVSADNAMLENLKFGNVEQLEALYLNNNKLGYASLLSTIVPASYTYSPQDSIRIPATFDIDTDLDLSAQLFTADNVATNAKFAWFDGEKPLIADTDYTENEGVFRFVNTHSKLYGEVSASIFPELLKIPTTSAVVLATTGVENMRSDNSISISTHNGRLLINALIEQPVKIYSITGSLIRSFDKLSGQVELELARGTYLVNRTKVIL